jgi:biotin operon repressor
MTTQAMLNILALCGQADKDNPVTRERLTRATGMPDRRVRREIEALRKEGYRICSNSARPGYWLCHTEAEYLIFRKDYASRVLESLRTLNRMDKAVEGQIVMPSNSRG